jgi:DNA-binding Xre family transcriptional regulator
MLGISEAFDKTLKEYKITGIWLSQHSGVNPQVISRFRNGQNIQTDTLEKLLAPLSSQVKDYFYSLLMSRGIGISLESTIASMNERELRSVLFAIAARMQNSSQFDKEAA